jgi:hypothetical protein
MQLAKKDTAAGNSAEGKLARHQSMQIQMDPARVLACALCRSVGVIGNQKEDRVGGRYSDLLTERIKASRYPSLELIDRLERVLSATGDYDDYVDILLDKLQEGNYPSQELMNRVERVIWQSDRFSDYLEFLMSNIEGSTYPSKDLLDRIENLMFTGMRRLQAAAANEDNKGQ